ncbi:MAG: hypothetical protein V3S89_03710, partial [Desulfobacterales bacterium]
TIRYSCDVPQEFTPHEFHTMRRFCCKPIVLASFLEVKVNSNATSGVTLDGLRLCDTAADHSPLP